MEMTLNLLADQPTANNRTYSKKVLKETLTKKDIPIVSMSVNNQEYFKINEKINPDIDLKDVIGFANLNKFSNKKITFDVRFPKKEEYKKILKEHSYDLTMNGLGRVNENNQVTEFKLTHLSPILKEKL